MILLWRFLPFGNSSRFVLLRIRIRVDVRLQHISASASVSSDDVVQLPLPAPLPIERPKALKALFHHPFRLFILARYVQYAAAGAHDQQARRSAAKFLDGGAYVLQRGADDPLVGARGTLDDGARGGRRPGGGAGWWG